MNVALSLGIRRPDQHPAVGVGHHLPVFLAEQNDLRELRNRDYDGAAQSVRRECWQLR
jgi:hypothetical protein